MRRLNEFLLALFLSCTAICAGAQSAPPTFDTYTFSGQPNQNFGTQPLLIVQPGTNSYLQFNLSTLPAGASIQKATLRLFVDAYVSGGSFDVFQVSASWNENALTYKGNPGLGISATGGHPVSISASSVGQFVVVDITTLVQIWVQGISPNNGIALVLQGTRGAFSFDSKESTATSHQPELEIVLNGPAGPQGPQGPQGVTGAAGPQGPVGVAGPAGAQGPVGPAGPQGPTGPTGAQGPIGPAGAQGGPGPQGAPGPAGPIGPIGPMGLSGPAGAQGAPGADGKGFNFRGAFDPNAIYPVNDVATSGGSTYIAIAPSAGPNNPPPDQNSAAWNLLASAGEKGPQGDTGPQGPTGPTGAQGPIGQAGAQGAPGPQGVPGPAGPIGPSGPMGLPGPVGAQGAPGADGKGFNFRGAFDPSATYPVNDVATSAGSTYIAIAPSAGPNNPTPDQNPAAWNLIASAGEKGPQGDTGPQGLQGIAGAVGQTGAQGPPGPAGPIGPTGQAGPTGPTGATGPQGPIGPAGPSSSFGVYDANNKFIGIPIDANGDIFVPSVNAVISLVNTSSPQTTYYPSTNFSAFFVTTDCSGQVYIPASTTNAYLRQSLFWYAPAPGPGSAYTLNLSAPMQYLKMFATRTVYADPNSGQMIYGACGQLLVPSSYAVYAANFVPVTTTLPFSIPVQFPLHLSTN